MSRAAGLALTEHERTILAIVPLVVTIVAAAVKLIPLVIALF